MVTLIGLRKWIVIIAVAMIILVPLVAIGIMSYYPPYDRYGGGVATSYYAYAAVDDSLKGYVAVTAGDSGGAGGPGYGWQTTTGNVTWIGSASDSVHSLENLHLAIYTRLDNSTASGDLTLRQIGSHVVVNQTESNIPSDAIAHQEIIISHLGLDNPQFEYTFNCSTYIH